jgi:hypothetical protein
MRAPLVLAAALGALLPAASLAEGGAGNGAGRPVVVELFTSQGCSSCPPADALLAELARTRPDLLALSFHVTYWNNLGWTDPFSLPQATERQRRYVGLAVSPEVYTPAMVVDGRLDAIGSDRAAVASALARAAAEDGTAAPVRLARAGGEVEIAVGTGTGQGTIWLVGFDRAHATPVAGGENGGRTLTEADIVREIRPAGAWIGGPLRLRAAAPAGDEVAVIVQAADGRVLGAARLLP